MSSRKDRVVHREATNRQVADLSVVVVNDPLEGIQLGLSDARNVWLLGLIRSVDGEGNGYLT
jgi:hypothetical protein